MDQWEQRQDKTRHERYSDDAAFEPLGLALSLAQVLEPSACYHAAPTMRGNNDIVALSNGFFHCAPKNPNVFTEVARRAGIADRCHLLAMHCVTQGVQLLHQWDHACWSVYRPRDQHDMRLSHTRRGGGGTLETVRAGGGCVRPNIDATIR